MSKHENMSGNEITVGQLIKFLKEFDPARIVVISCDGEGNSYSPLCNFYEAAYSPECTWNGVVGLETLTADDERQGYTDEDVIVGGIPCLVLKPVN